MERLSYHHDPVPRAFQREYSTRLEDIANPIEKEKVKEYAREFVSFINSPELLVEVANSHVTIAMVRPHADQNTVGLSDIELYSEIKNRMKEEGLEMLRELSLPLSHDFVESFYTGVPKERMEEIPAVSPEFESKWDEFVYQMTDAPTSILVLKHEENAVEHWRRIIGPTNPEKARSESPDSIRGKYAVDFNNNLVHGSDSPSSVVRELEHITEELENNYLKTTDSATSDFKG